MDEGKIHDKLGKEGDFSNALVLFTSNIGSNIIVEKSEQGSLPTSAELMDIMSKHFRPEFLSRITELVPFRPITEEIALKIFDIQLSSLLKSLFKIGIQLTIAEQAKKQLTLSGFNSLYGARQISGVIRAELNRPISKMVVGGTVKKGDLIEVSLDESRNEELKFIIKTGIDKT
ncbi:AAA family ATPase [Chitinophagaceae bacterium LWZ2-11]